MTLNLFEKNPKKTLFSVVTAILLSLVLLVEIVGHIYYLKTTARYVFASQYIYEAIAFRIKLKIAERKIDHSPVKAIYKHLYSNKGRTVLSHLKSRYEDSFQIFVKTAREIEAHLLVLYLPSSNNDVVTFFKSLCAKYNVEFLDLTDTLSAYPDDWVTLRPENGHLSRFGNKIVAKELKKYLDSMPLTASNHTFAARPKYFGDLRPNLNIITTIVPSFTA